MFLEKGAISNSSDVNTIHDCGEDLLKYFRESKACNEDLIKMV